MAVTPGAKDGDKISDLLRDDIFNEKTLGFLKQLASAAAAPKADGKVNDILGGFDLVDDGAGAGKMPRLQRERTPDRMPKSGEQVETVAVATKEGAVNESSERVAVAGLQNLIKEAFISPEGAAAEERAMANGQTEVEHSETAEKAAEASQPDFDLFQLG